MATPSPQEKVTLVLPAQHSWLKGLRGSSLVIEYLLDKEFGTKTGSGEDADKLAAEKIVQAQRIMEKMRKKKLIRRDEPD
jgi:hypothetical protein